MNNRGKAYIKMHIAVLLFGITAILGKLISISAIPLVWHRLWISAVGLMFIPGIVKAIFKIDRKTLLRFAGIGIIAALHWMTFYHSIKIGDSASITLACLATSTLFTSILEPLITKSKFQISELGIGILVVIGIYILSKVGSFYYKAIVVGLISAFLASLFSTLNKKYILNHNSISVSLVELFSGWVFLSLAIPFIYQFPEQTEMFVPSNSDWLWLAVLGLLCTSLAFVLALEALKELSAFISNLSVNLEPVYGIILAAILFKENKDLDAPFYIGTSIILGAVILHPVLSRRKRNKEIEQGS